MNRIVLFAATASCIAFLPARSGAQRQVVSAEVTFGTSVARGGAYGGDRSGAALDGLVATRSISPGRLHAILGVAGGLEGPNAKSNNCLRNPTAGCVPDFPRIYSFGLLFGAEHVGRFGDARLMTGPTNYRASGGGSTLGLQTRLQLATPTLYHVQLVGSARGGYAWHLDRQNVRLGAVGIGIGVR